MFVKSKMSRPMKYYKGIHCVVLKPNTVTLVDETKVSAKELIECYGQRIDILSTITEDTHLPEEEVKPVEAKKPVVAKKENIILEERQGDITLASINKILEEIEEPVKEEVKIEEPEAGEEIEEPVKEEVKIEEPVKGEVKKEEVKLAKEVKTKIKTSGIKKAGKGSKRTKKQ